MCESGFEKRNSTQMLYRFGQCGIISYLSRCEPWGALIHALITLSPPRFGTLLKAHLASIRSTSGLPKLDLFSLYVGGIGTGGAKVTRQVYTLRYQGSVRLTDYYPL